MIKLPNGIKEDDILNQVAGEYGSISTKLENRHERIRDNRGLYVNIEDQDEKIYDRTMYTVTQTLLALYYRDAPIVEFRGRQLGDEEQAFHKNNLWKFDHDEMNCDEKNYHLQFHRIYDGWGTEVFTGFSPVTKTPRYFVPDTLDTYPSFNYDIDKGFAHYGIEIRCSKYELTEKHGYFNLKGLKSDTKMKVEKIVEEQLSKGKSLQQIRNELANQDSRLLTAFDGGDGDHMVSLFCQYTRIGSKPYMFVFGNERTLLIKAQEIKPVYKEEYEDPTLIPFPVTHRRWSPFRPDPLGIALPDLLRDKQQAQQLFMFLNKIKAENEAWGDFFLYDPAVVNNILDIQQPRKGPTFIEANMSNANGSPIMEVPKARVKSDSYQMPEILRQEGQRATGVDETQLGIIANEVRTATEHQRTQRNANLRMILSSKVDAWAEKRKARIRDRLYSQYFKPTEEKNIYLNNGFGQMPYLVKGEDFDTQKNIDISVKHKADTENERQAKKDAYMVWSNMLLQMATSEHQRNHTMREFGKSLGLDKEVVASHVPDTADEMQAKLDLELINRNQDPGAIGSVMEDHDTYLAIYQEAYNTDAKRKAIRRRRLAKVMKKRYLEEQQRGQQGQGGQPSEQTVTNNAQNTNAQLTSNFIQKMNRTDQNAASLQDVA